MRSRWTSWKTLLWSLAALAVLTAATPGEPPLAAGPGQGGDAPPCGATISRSIDKRVVKEGESFAVHVEFDFDCPSEKKRVNVIILVENTEYLRGPSGTGNELLDNVKSALKQFVNVMDYPHGSTGGLTLYSTDFQNRVPLQGGTAGQDNLLKAIDLISVKPAGNASGLVSAMRDATQRLPERTTEADNYLLIINAGGPLYSTGILLSDLEDSCQAAEAAEVTRIIVNLAQYNNGLDGVRHCQSPGWSFRSADPVGKDLVGPGGILDVIASRALSQPQVTQHLYRDRLSGYLFEYVIGSGLVNGSPVAPNLVAGSEVFWSFGSKAPVGGTVIDYRVKAYDDSGVGKSNLSMTAQLELTMSDRRNAALPAPNFSMCVYTDLEPDYCDGFVTPTPPGTPDTPTPTATPETPTPPRATDTPTPTGSPTPTATAPASETPATGAPVFLPLLLNGQELR